MQGVATAGVWEQGVRPVITREAYQTDASLDCEHKVNRCSEAKMYSGYV